MDAMGMMRDLDQIRERDDEGGSPRVVVLALGGLATACVLFAAGVLIGRDGDGQQARRREDPLLRLDALAGQVAHSEPVPTTFVDRLGATAAQGTGTTPPGTVAAPEARTGNDALGAGNGARPELGLPSGTSVDTLGVAGAVPSVATLAPAAANQGHVAMPAAVHTGPAANPGTDGPFTLQVSSFRAAAPAQTLALRLRERGYHAFVAPAAPVARAAASGPAIQWHRVRIGPFTSMGAANQFRQQFEGRERMPSFVVRRDDPRMRQGE